MGWESDENKVETKDRPMLLWLIVAIVFVAMIVAVTFNTKKEVDQTRVRSKHILIAFEATDFDGRTRALETINDLRKRILAGEDFGKLAAEYSDDPGSGKRGGHLDWSDQGDFVDAFEAYVWEAPFNELSEVIQTQHGFHLIVVLDRELSSYTLYEREIRERVQDGTSNP